LYQKIINASNSAGMFALIEKYFLQYQADQNTEHAVVQFIDSNIDKPIEWLVHKSGYSQKHVIHLLKKHTGFSPKYLQRLYRFQLVVKDIQNQKNAIDWFSVVHRHGYYDQAHLIKEFTHFSGISPTEYIHSQAAITENSLVSDMILKLPS
jgi:AraC-like DNA-binding protein